MKTPGESPILAVDGLTKRFPGVLALDGVTFDLRPGEVHALCGENGAGKSTLIKCLSGIHPVGSYEGEIRVDGRPAGFSDVGQAERAGIAVIYQELALVREMSVAENIFLGGEPTRWGLIDWERLQLQARDLMRDFGMELDPSTPAGALGIGRQQMVEIVKALSKRSRVLLLDEPTAALTETEVEALLNIVRDLRRRGIACLYISHKLEEVFSIADRVTVLRDGRTVMTAPASETSRREVIRHMVGREIRDLFPRRSGPVGETLLDVRGLCVREPGGKQVLEDISFEVRAGETVGFGGLMGAGRTELLMHLFGAWGERSAGAVTLRGQPLEARSPGESIRRGLALVSEDRRRHGFVPGQSVSFNLSLSSLKSLTSRGLIHGEREIRRCREFVETLRVKASGLDAEIGGLSGGNQQKVVIGKALMTEPSVVFLDEPTRGIDVGAKLEVYDLINQLTDRGKAVVIVSSELPELMGMCDRMIILSRGRVGGTFRRGEAEQVDLMAAAMKGAVGEGAGEADRRVTT